MLAVPNFSTGRDAAATAAIREALGAATVLDVHTDPDHDRSVFTLTGSPDELVSALAAAAAVAIAATDMAAYDGAHPAIGALDVAPLVWLAVEERGVARDAALDVADTIAALDVPVFLYGELASASERSERAFFRRGGPAELRRRMEAGLAPDRGPTRPHPRGGATLVTARPPLAAFNMILDGADREGAAAVAARLRESGGGLPGVRAIAVELGDGRMQVSTNVHDPVAVPLADVVSRARELAGGDARIAAAEIVGLVPEAALAGFPADLPIEGFDPRRRVIERRLAAG